MFRLSLLSILFFSATAQAQVIFMDCPEGTKKKSVLEKDEIHEWCADKDGVRSGGYSLRTSDGIPKVYVEYKNDKREGQYARYHANGKPAEQGMLKNDKPVGQWKRFHKNGAISDVGSWDNGEPAGNWKFYHSTGKLEAQGVYKNGDRAGVWKLYDKNGKFSGERNYDNKGLLVEAGYLGLYDGNGESHSGLIGVNWFPFQNNYLKGFSVALRIGSIKAGGDGPDGSEDLDLAMVSFSHYWQFGRLLAGVQIGNAETDGDDGNFFYGIDTYLTVNQRWVKRYGFNLSMLDNDIAAITAKAVIWEF